MGLGLTSEAGLVDLSAMDTCEDVIASVQSKLLKFTRLLSCPEESRASGDAMSGRCLRNLTLGESARQHLSAVIAGSVANLTTEDVCPKFEFDLDH